MPTITLNTTERVEACPHCGVVSQFASHPTPLRGVEFMGRPTGMPDRVVEVLICRHCHGLVIEIRRPLPKPSGMGMGDTEWSVERAFPTKLQPPTLSDDVPKEVRDAHGEAWVLQNVNERAAAVMARRCLQLALRKAGFTRRTLNAEIEAAEQVVSPDLATQLHYVREVGNIGAHPMDADGGLDFDRLIDVQPGELHALFSAIREALDEFFVRPARKQRDLDALNARLVAAGKKPITPKR